MSTQLILGSVILVAVDLGLPIVPEFRLRHQCDFCWPKEVLIKGPQLTKLEHGSGQCVQHWGSLRVS